MKIATRAGVCPVSRQTKTVSTMEDAVPWMWIDPPISAGTGKRSGACQTSIENGDAHGMIGVQLVVVVGEDKRSARV